MTAPNMLSMPPTITMITTVMDVKSVKSLGVDEVKNIAHSPPAKAQNAACTTNARSFHDAVLMPNVDAATSLTAIARRARPTRDCSAASRNKSTARTAIHTK